jgi:hypothetical protein
VDAFFPAPFLVEATAGFAVDFLLGRATGVAFDGEASEADVPEEVTKQGARMVEASEVFTE